MSGVKFRFRAVAVSFLAAGSWLACSSSEHPDVGESTVAVTQQALDPSWTPESLNPVAHFVATTGVTSDAAGVNTWNDFQNRLSITQSVDVQKPHLNATGWASTQPTVHFDGGDYLHLDTWSSSPAGTSTPLAVLAVLRPTVTADAEVVGWWDPNGGGSAWAGIKMSDGRALPDLGRTFSLSSTAAYSGVHDLGTGSNAGPHVIVWRYLPDSQTIKLTVDGAATPPSNALAPIGPLPQMPLLVGAGTLTPSRLFIGDLSELVILASLLSDADVQNFTDYARLHWSGLPTTGSTDPCRDAGGANTPSTVRCDDNNTATYGDHCSSGTCAGTVPPPGSPAELTATAWFHAGAPEVALRDGGVETWFDRTGHHLDISNGFYFGRPNLVADGWTTGKPTLGFVGHSVLFRDSWTGNPGGTDADFSVLAVLQPSSTQTTGVSAWWSQVYAGRIACDLKTTGTTNTLDLFRTDPYNNNQDFTGAATLGTAKHVVVWRYSPGKMQLSVDGNNVPNPGMTAISALNPEMFLVGEDSGFANTLLNANVAELAVIPRSINDAELGRYASYAQAEWGGLTLCAPSCSACGGSDGCGGVCDCGGACSSSAQCSVGFSCVSGHCSTSDGGGGGPGSICTSDVQCNAGLLCVGGQCEPGAPGSICSSDVNCLNGVHCASGTCGGAGAACGTCAPELVCTDGTCHCAAICDGKACGADDGCGGTCKCPLGQTGCNVAADCVDGAICANNTCMLPDCLKAPQLIGCGTPGAKCGPSCTPHPLCASDADCPTNYYCPEDNGWRYGVPDARVCQKHECDPDPTVLGCGDFFSECGVCYCTPQCQDKHCGDADLSDGCGRTCTGVCAVSESGCANDSDCAGGVCRGGTCRPAYPCANILVQPPDCGSDTSTCGPCLNPPPQSTSRECGIDPATHIDAGPCPPSYRCTAEGQCAATIVTPAIQVNENGTIRTISPPTSPPSSPVGAIPGSFEVSDRGSAVYTIPIEVPPGGPITPALALRYASTSGNGALGVGWSLDGLSQITRCQKNYAQDGLAKPIAGTDQDGLCLDGQRLAAMRLDWNGYTATSIEYRAVIDTFTRVQGILADPSVSLPDHFIAYTKDGRKLTYGQAGTLANGEKDTWVLTRVEDRSGNFMTVDYTDFHPADANGVISTAEILPTAITYGGRYGTMAGDRIIRFMYDVNRPDELVGWRAPGGTLFTRSYRLKSIDVSAGAGRVRSYQLGYEVVRGTSRLTSLRECSSSDALCKPATSFDYYDEFGFETGTTVYVDCDRNQGPCPNGADANIVNGLSPYGIPLRNQGKDHLATATILTTVDTGLVSFFDTVGLGLSVLSLGGSAALSVFATVASTTGSQLGIENNEFVALDLAISAPDSNGFTHASYSQSGEHVGCLMPAREAILDTPLSPDPSESLTNICPQEYPTGKIVKGTVTSRAAQIAELTPRIWYVDIDGDGLQDQLMCASNRDKANTTELSVIRATKLSTGVHIPQLHDDPEPNPLPAFGDMCQIFCNNEEEHCQAFQAFTTLLDVNGDGTSELVAADSKNHLAALMVDKDSQGNLTGAWHDEYFAGLTLSPNDDDYVVTMDVNGDGLRDLVALPSAHLVSLFPTRVKSALPRVAYNTGAGFVERSLTVASDIPLLAPQYSPFVMDYDHDGLDDLLEPPSSESRPWRLWRFKDNQVTLEGLTELTTGPGTLGDFDGDGNVDLLTGSGSYPAGHFLLSRGRGRRDHLLKRVTDGMGRYINVEYDGTRNVGNPGNTDDPDAWLSEVNAQSHWTPGWPIRVSHVGKTGHALVTVYREGHYTSQARDPNGGAQLDRELDYDYGDWATDVAGYGPLGFDSRLIVERDGEGIERGRRLIDFNVTPPAPSASYYVRPLVGLPVKITELSHAVEASATTQGYTPRTETTFDWQVGNSSENLPFPYLAQKVTETGVSVVSWNDENPPKLVAAMQLPPLAERFEGYTGVDKYGNVWSSEVWGTDIPHTRVDRDFTPDPADEGDWLINLVHSEASISGPANCTSNCDNDTRHRYDVFTYYSHTNLPHTVEREPGITELERLTTIDRYDTGNIRKVVTTDLALDTREVDVEFDDRQLFPVSITRVGGGTSQTTQVRYDDRFGSMTARVDPNGIDETWSYDDFGVQRLSHGPNGDGSVNYDVDQQPQPPATAIYQITASEAGGESSTGEYNALGQLVRRKTTGLLDKEVFEEREYDWRNRLSQAWRPHLENDSSQDSNVYTYDLSDRLQEVLEPRALTSSGSGLVATHYFYGLQGSTDPDFYEMGGVTSTRVVDPDGRVTTKSFNAQGQLIMAYDREGDDPTDPDTDHPFATTYVYGAFGDLVEIDAEGDTPPLVLTRDDYGRVISSFQPYRGLQEATTTYNGLDEPTHTVDHAGRFRDPHYDDFGRIDSVRDDDGVTQWIYDVDFAEGDGAHDTIGRLVRTVSPTDQTVDYIYGGPAAGKNRGLLSGITEHVQAPLVPNGSLHTVHLSVNYTYDDNSRLTRVDYPEVAGSRFAVQYGFDNSGHVIAASQPDDLRNGSDPAAVYWQLIDQNEGIRIKSECLGDANCTRAGVLTTRHFDDHTGQLDDIQSALGSNVFQHLTYQYNDSGNMVGRSDKSPSPNRTETFGYDNAGRLQSINGQIAFHYSATGHGLGYQAGVGPYTPQLGDETEPADHYWTHNAGDNTYERNAAGAQISRSGPGVQSLSQTVDYTTFDLPSQVSQGGGYGVDFSYDASGTRVVKATSTSGAPGDTTYYLGDLFHRIEHPSGPATNRNMIYAGGRLVAIATTSDADPTHPTLHYLHSDALGSIQTITAANGSVEATRDFSVFGVERGGNALFDEVPYGFTGQEHDADLGLINMKGRIYDPVLAQFLSPDPFMPTPMGHGLNGFAYVNNRPLDFIDPSGFEPAVDWWDSPIASSPSGSMQSFEATVYGTAPAPGTVNIVTDAPPAGTMGTEATAESFQAGAMSVAETIGALTSIGFEIYQIATLKPNPTKSTPLPPSRSPQSAGSTVAKVPNNSRVAPTTLDPGCVTWRAGCIGPPPPPSVQEGAASAGPMNPGSNIGTVPCHGTPEECARRAMEFNLTGGGFIPDGALIGVGEAIVSLWRWLLPARALTSGDIGGSVIGWGTGQTAEAVAQTNAVTQSLTRGAVRQMIKRGLTQGWVEEQLAMYRTAALNALKAAKNAQLAPRTALMEKILELWPK